MGQSNEWFYTLGEPPLKQPFFGTTDFISKA